MIRSVLVLVLLFGSVLADDPEVQLKDGTRVRVLKRVVVNINSRRDLHGPCVVRAGNGDLLLSHQDSDKHGGGDGFVRQWRSRDNGLSWKDEGPVADWRNRGLDSLFGEYGRVPGGPLVMVVQRRRVLGGDLGITASWVQVSTDHGKTWKELGPVDDSNEYAVMFGRNLQVSDDTLFMGAWSRLGNSLYVSSDRGVSWKKRSVMFPGSYPDFKNLKKAGPPFYPHVVFCPDGSLLAMTYHTPPRNHCYSRRSRDGGQTWEPIRVETRLPLWAPRMKRLNASTLIVTGRDIGERATVAWFSTDSGLNWHKKLVVDRPQFSGSYAYTDSISAGKNRFWIFTSSPRSKGKGDIVGVLLAVTSAPVSETEKSPVDASIPEKVGNLDIPDVTQMLRVDRNKRPSREAMRNSAFILKTRPHPVAGNRYVILTDHRQPQFLSSLHRLAKARDGILLQVDDLAVLYRDPEQLESLRKKLRDAPVRFLAIAPRMESFRENMVLGMWELTSTLDDDPQLDVLPGILLASSPRHLSALVDRSIRHKPQPASRLRPLAISQVPRVEELRSLQKAGVLRKWFSRAGVATPVMAVYSRRAVEAAKLSGTNVWNLQATSVKPFVKSFPKEAGEAFRAASLVVMHGHGVPGMSCGIDVDGLPADLLGKVILSGSCFSASPVRSDFPALRQVPGGYQVKKRDAFALRALDNGATVFFGHMRLSMGFPHLFPVLEAWLEGKTVGESYQQLINALIMVRGFRPGRFVVSPERASGRRVPQNLLLYVAFGDPALRPFEKAKLRKPSTR